MKAKKVIAMLLAATLSVTAFTGCAINKTATVATLDKEDIIELFGPAGKHFLNFVNYRQFRVKHVVFPMLYAT